MLKTVLLGKNFGMKAGLSCADDTTVDVTRGLSHDFTSGVAEIINGIHYVKMKKLTHWSNTEKTSFSSP